MNDNHSSSELTYRPRWLEPLLTEGRCQDLRLFLQEYSTASCGVLVHTGTQIRRLDEKIIAVPWTYLAG